MNFSLNKRWAPVFLALASLLLVASIACGGDSDDGDSGTSSAAAAAPAAPAAPAAKAASAAAAKAAAPGGKSSAAKAAEAAKPAAKAAAAAKGEQAAAAAAAGKAAPAATAAKAAAAVSATKAPTSASGGPEGSLVRAFRTLESVYGLGYVGPYRTSATVQLGGVEESLFNYQNGNPMTPFLVDSWDIDAAGTRARMTLKKGLKFQSPIGYEDTDFGELDAAELVEWFNRSNATTNPESTYGDAGDFAAIFLEAKAMTSTQSKLVL